MATNTTGAQDKYINEAIRLRDGVDDAISNLLSVIDDLDSQLSEALAESSRLRDEVRAHE